MESVNLLAVNEEKDEFRSRSRRFFTFLTLHELLIHKIISFCNCRGSCIESLTLLSVNENQKTLPENKNNDNEVEKSLTVTANLNEDDNSCDKLEPVENNENTAEEVDSDNDVIDWQESDLWKQTKPITVIKDISKKVKARRASLMPTEQRRR